MRPILFLSTLLVCGLAPSCTTLLSHFDDVHLISSHKTPVAEIGAPSGFVVSPQKVESYIPITKYAWNIYADSKKYYLSPALQDFSVTGDNSWNARKNGIPIRGTTNEDVVKIDRALNNTTYSRFRSARELQSAIEE